MPDTPPPSGSQRPSHADAPTALIVLSTWPSVELAAAAARVVVEEQLAACVNLVPQVRSIYRWQGAVSDDTEILAVIKTTRDRYAALARRLVGLHPYEVPEVIAIPLADGHAPYLAWLAASTRGPGSPGSPGDIGRGD